jgi:hypothetical protein
VLHNLDEAMPATHVGSCPAASPLSTGDYLWHCYRLILCKSLWPLTFPGKAQFLGLCHETPKAAKDPLM